MAAEPRIELRHVTPANVDVFFEHQRDELAWRMAGVKPRSREAYRAHWLKILADPEIVTRAVFRDDVLVGQALSFPQPDGRHVGYWFGREHWGQGIAKHALGLLLSLLTERPLLAVVTVHNLASQRVLESWGFARDHERPPASAEDSATYLYRLDG